MNYTDARELDGWVQAYVIMIGEDRQFVTRYHLEHPQYDTDDEYAHILEAWLHNREWWYRKHNEPLPKPKRRAGRVRTKESIEREQAKEAARQKKAEARAAAAVEKQKFAARISLGLDDELFSAIGAVRGDLSVEECIRQLLRHALGPLPDVQEPTST